FGIHRKVTTHHPGIITWFHFKYLFNGFPFMFTKAKDFYSVVVVDHPSCKIDGLMDVCEAVQRFNVVLYRSGNVAALVYKLPVFVAFYLSLKNFERCQHVGLSGMCIYKFFLTIEFVCCFKRTLFHLMKYILHVNKISVVDIERNSCTQEFFHENGDVKFIGVKTTKIRIADKRCKIRSKFLECRSLCHILGIDSMNQGAFKGDIAL